MKLWLTDEELIDALGVPVEAARIALAQLDADVRSGFPQKQKLWGNRRYLPAVQAYFEVVYVRPISAARLIPENRPPQSAAALSTLRSLRRRGHG